MNLAIETSGRTLLLSPGQQLTFGRDSNCDLCLDPADLGLSRFAGQIKHENGIWIVTNLSRKRPLHIVDHTGFAVPLPVSVDGAAGRRAVDQPRITVLVPGDSLTHALVLSPDRFPHRGDPSPEAADPHSTRTQRPLLTDRRREVVVAMAAGYLRPYPRYDPHPRTYQEVADLLGLSKTQVTKRIEDVREELVSAGVRGLQSELDTRRALCEWLLAMRLIGPADLDWLRTRIDAAHAPQPRGAASATEPAVRRPAPDRAPRRPATARRADEPELPATTHPAADEITRIAERTARDIAPALLARLRHCYGEQWLAGVNANRPPGARQRRQNLRDYRFCLWILGNDTSTAGWASDDCRHSARDLNRLANLAAHRRTLTTADIERARVHGTTIANELQPGR